MILTSDVGNVTATSAATVNTVMARDASGNSNINRFDVATLLALAGGLVLKTSAKSASFTADTAATIYTVDTTSGSATMTLPAVSGNAGLIYAVKKIVAANSLIVDGSGSELIDGALTLTATAQYAALLFYCDGSAWYTISRQGTFS